MTSGGPGPSPDATAAHQLLTELRTRIATQPLPYQHGVEARALESLWEVFAQARAAIKDNPGCSEFASRATEMLNIHLRPMTAKWHRAHRDGRLNSRDGTNEFRADLREIQVRLNEFADALHEMAYGTVRKDALAPFPIDEGQLSQLMAELPFGIRGDDLVPIEVARAIDSDEREAILLRRKLHGIANERPVDAVGLGLSGGGIRSASFCLGVVQVLSDRGLLKEIDYLSTVSGGGYVGSFLTRPPRRPIRAGRRCIAARSRHCGRSIPAPAREVPFGRFARGALENGRRWSCRPCAELDRAIVRRLPRGIGHGLAWRGCDEGAVGLGIHPRMRTRCGLFAPCTPSSFGWPVVQTPSFRSPWRRSWRLAPRGRSPWRSRSRATYRASSGWDLLAQLASSWPRRCFSAFSP